MIFACYPHLLKLLGSLNGIDSLVDITAPVFPGFDVYTALMSVPHVIGLEANMIPAEAPYLFPDPESRNIWTSVVDHQALHVGLVWKTNTANRAAVQRSLPLSELVPLASIPGITWHSLQIGESAELEMKDVGLPFSFVSHPQRVDTMEATAGLVASLDLVISIDTSIAHLAGAMGIPVWTMLPYASDWRWMIHRETTAWYPTMRLYRQDNPGDWSGVVRHIGSDLHCLSNSADTGEEAHG